MHSKHRPASNGSRGPKARESREIAYDAPPGSAEEKRRALQSSQSLSGTQPDSVGSQRGGSKDFANDVERASDTGRTGGERSDEASVERPEEV
jgi:general stress protein YciG